MAVQKYISNFLRIMHPQSGDSFCLKSSPLLNNLGFFSSTDLKLHMGISLIRQRTVSFFYVSRSKVSELTCFRSITIAHLRPQLKRFKLVLGGSSSNVKVTVVPIAKQFPLECLRCILPTALNLHRYWEDGHYCYCGELVKGQGHFGLGSKIISLP